MVCRSNADCLTGFTCRDTMCLPHCTNDQECALNERCLEGNCLLTCRVDNDCFLGHICLNSRCVFGCKQDSDCSASETCRNNRCSDPCLDNVCGPNAICTVTNQRATCSCIHGMVPSPTAKIGCIRSPALPCSENRDCPDGEACFNDLCRPVCADDGGCLSNERCDNGACKPICRRDDDCRNGEVCQGLVCTIGCRSDAGCPDDHSCVNQQCVNACADATSCGTNAVCTAINHRQACSCPAPLVGDPLVACKYESTHCQTKADCPQGHTCYGNVCQASCRNDQNCLADERCMRGVCRSVCNSDSACGLGFICENRLCQAGCRSDTTCPDNEACINKKCTDPCGVLGQCGNCAECTVINHGVQCSCPTGFLGNPLAQCTAPAEKCNSYCECDESGAFCAERCSLDSDCACGQKCYKGKCRAQCSQSSCAPGQLCQNGACMPGCKTNSDCSIDRSCVNGQCTDPCANDRACGKNAICKAADHRALCLCPDGFRGEPSRECLSFECQTNDDCDVSTICDNGQCKNPCLDTGACGNNAQCKVINRHAECSCPSGYFGNPLVGCEKLQCQKKSCGVCKSNPCGSGALCEEVPAGYQCKCPPLCTARDNDPRNGCICIGDTVTLCNGYQCGINAQCRVNSLHGQDIPECFCPPELPYGNPLEKCKINFTHVCLHFYC